MINAIIRPKLKARYRLPVDPCRMLGGKRQDPQQSRPAQLFNQVSPQQFLSTIRSMGATTQSRGYKARMTWQFRHGYRHVDSYKPKPVFIPRG